MIPSLIVFNSTDEYDAFMESLGVPCQEEEPKKEKAKLANPLTGGSVGYYSVDVDPLNKPAYTAECGDIIDTLGLTFSEANIFKEIWRSANARLGNGKPGNTPLRGAEKIAYYANRILAAEKQNSELTFKS
jgi:hypothetical protein